MNIKPQTSGSITIAVQSPVTLDPTKSSLIVSPRNISYGYGNNVTVNITVKDTNGNPVGGATVATLTVFAQTQGTLYLATPNVTTNSSGQAQITIPVDQFPANKVPVNATVRAIITYQTSSMYIDNILAITGKMTTIQLATDKQTYIYGDTIQLTITPKDAFGNTGAYVPIYIRIKRSDGTVVKDFGKVLSSPSYPQTTSISVDQNNFPQAGSYTIEVADNASYSPTAIPLQVDFNSIFNAMLAILVISILINLMVKVSRRVRGAGIA